MKGIGSLSMRARGKGVKLREATILVTLVTTLFAGAATCLAQGKPEPLNKSNLIQQTLDKAFAARVKPHPELKPFPHTAFDADVVVVSPRAFVMRMPLPNNSGVFHIYFVSCKPDAATPALISDAVILGPMESARKFYDDNLYTSLSLAKAEFVLCQPEGSEFTQTGNISKSRTRILSHLGGLLRYFLEFKPDPRRGADLLQVAATEWREELQERAQRKNLRAISQGLFLIDRGFPFDLFDRTPLDPPTRAALRELLTTTLFLRQKLGAFDEKARASIKRDEALLARLGPP